MTRDEVRRRDALEREMARGRIDRSFVAAGHHPEYRTCDHKHYRFYLHGRYCTCGTCMVDPGD